MEVNNRYRPVYHMSVPAGWGNDPNGMIFYKGQCHFFYQYNPYAPHWGTMHWGHAVSDDMIKWTHLPPALVPNEPYERELGCFSGTAIEDRGLLYLMYTAAASEVQQQCLAFSEDGLYFEKVKSNPVIPCDNQPEGGSHRDFRDPKVFKHDGIFYCIVGGNIDGKGNLLLYRSDDLMSWRYIGHLFEPQGHIPSPFFNVDGVCECPDYFVIDGEEVLLFNPQNHPTMGYHYENVHSSVAMCGHLDFEAGRFTIRNVHELDAGFDFYAPQTLTHKDGRQIMMAWKEMWFRTYPTVPDNWIGTYTLPRVLTIQDGRVYQNPIQEIEAYRRHKRDLGSFKVDNGYTSFNHCHGQCFEMNVTIKPDGKTKQAGVKLLKGGMHEIAIYYDVHKRALVFDRSQSGTLFEGRDETTVRTCIINTAEPVDQIDLRIFVDVSSIEVFINGGRYVMTGNVYPESPKEDRIEFFSNGGVTEFIDVTKYAIVVK